MMAQDLRALEELLTRWLTERDATDGTEVARLRAKVTRARKRQERSDNYV